jgi:hypothetical protein
LRQLSHPSGSPAILEPVVLKYQEREDEDNESYKLELDESVELIVQIAKQYPSMTIVLDALDECRPESRHRLLFALDDIIQKSENLVKIFMSSRDDTDLVRKLENSPNLYIKASDNAEDIQRFVHTEVERAISEGTLLDGDVSLDLRQLVTKRLVNGAQGMYVTLIAKPLRISVWLPYAYNDV